MKFQTIIIGGGLSGLVAGIRLAKAGRKVAIISSGQSALHFSSGSLELLGSVDGQPVSNPLETIASLPAEHPYSRIGKNLEVYTNEVKPMMEACGISLDGSYEANSYTLTPLGKIKPSWLIQEDFLAFPSRDKFPYSKVALFNIAGFLDFYPEFISLGLSNMGVECESHVLNAPIFERMRKNPTEMRAVNIARTIDKSTLVDLAVDINHKLGKAMIAFIPAVLAHKELEFLRSRVNVPLYCIPTIPGSVPGMYMQQQLCAAFTRMGGVYMLGDHVNGGHFKGNKLEYITTNNLEDEQLRADNYILATGSFIGHGIVSNFDSVYEPIFGLDVTDNVPFANRADGNIYNSQPFMSYGVVTDERFRACRSGASALNLYVCGSVLGGCNPVEDGCGAGVAILTALKVSSLILE